MLKITHGTFDRGQHAAVNEQFERVFLVKVDDVLHRPFV